MPAVASITVHYRSRRTRRQAQHADTHTACPMTRLLWLCLGTDSGMIGLVHPGHKGYQAQQASFWPAPLDEAGSASLRISTCTQSSDHVLGMLCSRRTGTNHAMQAQT